jgi:hypothetical protein
MLRKLPQNLPDMVQILMCVKNMSPRVRWGYNRENHFCRVAKSASGL